MAYGYVMLNFKHDAYEAKKGNETQFSSTMNSIRHWLVNEHIIAV